MSTGGPFTEGTTVAGIVNDTLEVGGDPPWMPRIREVCLTHIMTILQETHSGLSHLLIY